MLTAQVLLLELPQLVAVEVAALPSGAAPLVLVLVGAIQRWPVSLLRAVLEPGHKPTPLS